MKAALVKKDFIKITQLIKIILWMIKVKILLIATKIAKLMSLHYLIKINLESLIIPK